jgi:hypothetical protein
VKAWRFDRADAFAEHRAMHCDAFEVARALESARGLAQSKTLRAARKRPEVASAFGLRQSSAAFRLARRPNHRHPSVMPDPPPPWPHAPTHQLSTQGTYFVTASTYLKAHHFRGAERLRVVHRGLLTVARDFGWHFEAWAVFSNHYHFVGHSPPDAADVSNLSDMLSILHVKTAAWVNKLDRTPKTLRAIFHQPQSV